MVIAIDGPAASGKSSTARWVAETLRIRHADSGALYRAATLARLHAGGAAPWTEESVLAVLGAVTLTSGSTSYDVHVGGRPAGDALHMPAVTANVSAVAQMPRVRAWVNAKMRACAGDGPIVVDGRDMGTAVFPDAALKVFLIADPWERARRRLWQRLGRGATDDEIAAETAALVQRDSHDATQTQQAPDAVLIDTTLLTQEEQVERIVALARVAMSPT
jgi:cytidylate kinase